VSTGRRRNLRRSTARKTATANDSNDNGDDDVTDDDGGGDAVADDDGPADPDGTYAAANDAASSTDCRQYDESAVAVDDKNDYDEDCDDDDSDDDDDDDFEADGRVVVDEDVNVVAVVVSVETFAEDGREPLPLLIRAPPPRDLLVPLFLPKQVRGPVREVEEGEYDWEEDP